MHIFDFCSEDANCLHSLGTSLQVAFKVFGCIRYYFCSAVHGGPILVHTWV